MTAYSSTRCFPPFADPIKNKGNAVRNFWRTLLARTFLVAIASFALAGGTAEAAKFKVLHSFCEPDQHHNCNDGNNPAGLAMDQAGNFFGTTSSGGHDYGTVFELERKEKGGFKLETLYRFCPSECSDGAEPQGAPIIDAQGNLYGTTIRGGGNNQGVVFEISPGINGEKRWTERLLYSFCSKQNCIDGSFPSGRLTYAGAASGVPYDGVSPLYGITAGGGKINKGTVFELKNGGGTWTESVLHSFCSDGHKKCEDGWNPSVGLIMDVSGNLFGTATLGGLLTRAGIVFELSPNGDTWDYTTLYRFCSLTNCADGAGPNSPLVFDASGNLLGATVFGGVRCSLAGKVGCGTIFRLAPNGSDSQETILHSFCQQRDCKDGAYPTGGVVLDGAGNLYGVTQQGGGNDIDHGGSGGGTVFELTGTDLKVLHRFCSLANCADGERPDASVVMDEGALYGTTFYGGAYANGTFGGAVFRVMP